VVFCHLLTPSARLECLVSKNGQHHHTHDKLRTQSTQLHPGLYLHLGGKCLEVRVPGCKLYTELLADSKLQTIGERKRAQPNALSMMSRAFGCASPQRAALLLGAALAVLFDLAVRFCLAPAPRALVVQGSRSGLLLIVEANVREPRWHTCSPPLHGPPEAALSEQQGTDGGDPRVPNPMGEDYSLSM
jgi:hypothetical protein